MRECQKDLSGRELSEPLVICVAEDRKFHEPGIKLLLTSLCLRTNKALITLFYPPAEPAFLNWAKAYEGKVTINTTPISGAYGWNLKPQALLQLLRDGNNEVIWIDSDVIVTKDIRQVFSGLRSGELVVTEEALWGPPNDGDALRARAWGFQVGRTFPFALNTAVMRVTDDHIPLLERWREILESSRYRYVQQQPWYTRPIHMMSDQDVLTAILCSEEFCNVPVRIIRRGSGIIHFFGLFGFTVAERAICLFCGIPAFVHTQGPKPWLPRPDDKERRTIRSWVAAAYFDTSPYTLAARTLLPKSARAWADPQSRLGSAMRILALGYAPLAGAPIAVLVDAARCVRAAIKAFQSFWSP